jgi:hypothetical protein
MKARTLDRANVNKYVRPTIVWLNKAEALLARWTTSQHPLPFSVSNAREPGCCPHNM